MSVGVCLCLFCLWMSGGVSIDLGDIFGMPELLGSVFGDSPHEGLAQTGANSLFWPNPKRQEFVHLPFLRHQNIKTSLYAIFLNFHICQREITIHKLQRNTLYLSERNPQKRKEVQPSPSVIKELLRSQHQVRTLFNFNNVPGHY